MSGGELQRPWTSCPRDNFETEKLKWFKTWNHFAFCVWYKQVGIDWKYLSKFNIELQWFKSSFACLVFIELFISYVNFFFPFISQGAFIKIFISAADRHGCQFPKNAIGILICLKSLWQFINSLSVCLWWRCIKIYHSCLLQNISGLLLSFSL